MPWIYSVNLIVHYGQNLSWQENKPVNFCTGQSSKLSVQNFSLPAGIHLLSMDGIFYNVQCDNYFLKRTDDKIYTCMITRYLNKSFQSWNK